MFTLISRIALGLALQQGMSADTPGPTLGVSSADSVRILRAARSAQSAFESFRRSRLPFRPGMGGPCDIRIGRYCYWRGDDTDDEPRPPEPPAVQERRAALIATLDTASRTLNRDAWLAGQHVRYLVEADRAEDAARVARTECGATPRWCLALAGFAAHRAGKFADADAAFSAALTAMDSTERCHWLDITDLLDDDIEHRLSSLNCVAREQLARRILRLGSPLFSVSGTDLLTEHLSRITRARIAERAATPDGEPWGDDEQTLMIRYGWPGWYSQNRQDFGSQQRPSITGHDSGLPYNFLPSLAVVEHAGLATADDWHLDDPRARTGYAPAYARSVHGLPSQIARFRRGDSTLVVASWDARKDTTLLGRPLDAALVFAVDGVPRAVTRLSGARVTGHITAVDVLDSGLVSLELLASADRRAARERVGVFPRVGGRVALSDLLLYSPSATSPYELGVVQDSALASNVIPPSRAVGVFWETYGLRAGSEQVSFTLTLEQVGVGWLQRAAERLHVADPTTGLRVQWQEVPQRINDIAGRGVRVDLSRLRPGRYRMQLAVEADGEPMVTAVREIDVRK
ncbi:MAG: hypothetical protein ABJF01_20540 [bacterium]